MALRERSSKVAPGMPPDRPALDTSTALDLVPKSEGGPLLRRKAGGD